MASNSAKAASTYGVRWRELLIYVSGEPEQERRPVVLETHDERVDHLRGEWRQALFDVVITVREEAEEMITLPAADGEKPRVVDDPNFNESRLEMLKRWLERGQELLDLLGLLSVGGGHLSCVSGFTGYVGAHPGSVVWALSGGSGCGGNLGRRAVGCGGNWEGTRDPCTRTAPNSFMPKESLEVVAATGKELAIRTAPNSFMSKEIERLGRTDSLVERTAPNSFMSKEIERLGRTDSLVERTAPNSFMSKEIERLGRTDSLVERTAPNSFMSKEIERLGRTDSLLRRAVGCGGNWEGTRDPDSSELVYVKKKLRGSVEPIAWEGGGLWRQLGRNSRSGLLRTRLCQKKVERFGRTDSLGGRWVVVATGKELVIRTPPNSFMSKRQWVVATTGKELAIRVPGLLRTRLCQKEVERLGRIHSLGGRWVGAVTGKELAIRILSVKFAVRVQPLLIPIVVVTIPPTAMARSTKRKPNDREASPNTAERRLLAAEKKRLASARYYQEKLLRRNHTREEKETDGRETAKRRRSDKPKIATSTREPNVSAPPVFVAEGRVEAEREAAQTLAAMSGAERGVCPIVQESPFSNWRHSSDLAYRPREQSPVYDHPSDGSDDEEHDVGVRTLSEIAGHRSSGNRPSSAPSLPRYRTPFSASPSPELQSRMPSFLDYLMPRSPCPD
ncbi:hypothetical protein B0H12DRAFT_1070014 [Mycena haematopus]|nr:hypothetical protein B0H12DRAFT_1070014 [Mycena haematopus]